MWTKFKWWEHCYVERLLIQPAFISSALTVWQQRLIHRCDQYSILIFVHVARTLLLLFSIHIPCWADRAHYLPYISCRIQTQKYCNINKWWIINLIAKSTQKAWTPAERSRCQIYFTRSTVAYLWIWAHRRKAVNIVVLLYRKKLPNYSYPAMEWTLQQNVEEVINFDLLRTRFLLFWADNDWAKFYTSYRLNNLTDR